MKFIAATLSLIVGSVVADDQGMFEAIQGTFEGSLVASFSTIDYAWDDEHVRSEYIRTGQYNASVNAVAGIKIKSGVAANPEATEVFLSVPRWFNQVPSTLNKITVNLTDPNAAEDVALEPFPSWDMNEVGNCDMLQYVQSMEIDNNGLMWIVDTGRVGIFTDEPDNTCPPKLVIIDTETGEMVDEPYIFPTEVAPHDIVFLNDIVVDNARNVAYITDLQVGGLGALITYDRTTRTSTSFYNETMDPELGFRWNFIEQDLGVDTFALPVDAIALSPDGSRVLYGALQGGGTYSVDAAALRGEGDISPEDTIIDHGDRFGSTDGITTDCAGYLYYSDLNTASVYRWNTSLPSDVMETSELVHQNRNDMWWTDTFGWDDAGYLWATANHLPNLFVNGEFLRLNIFRYPVGTGSYQLTTCETETQDLPESGEPPAEEAEAEEVSAAPEETALHLKWISLCFVIGCNILLCIIIY